MPVRGGFSLVTRAADQSGHGALLLVSDAKGNPVLPLLTAAGGLVCAEWGCWEEAGPVPAPETVQEGQVTRNSVCANQERLQGLV